MIKEAACIQLGLAMGWRANKRAHSLVVAEMKESKRKPMNCLFSGSGWLLELG